MSRQEATEFIQRKGKIWLPLGTVISLISGALYTWSFASDMKSHLQKLEDNQQKMLDMMRSNWSVDDQEIWQYQMSLKNPTMNIPNARDIHRRQRVAQNRDERSRNE